MGACCSSGDEWVCVVSTLVSIMESEHVTWGHLYLPGAALSFSPPPPPFPSPPPLFLIFPPCLQSQPFTLLLPPSLPASSLPLWAPVSLTLSVVGWNIYLYWQAFATPSPPCHLPLRLFSLRVSVPAVIMLKVCYEACHTSPSVTRCLTFFWRSQDFIQTPSISSWN